MTLFDVVLVSSLIANVGTMFAVSIRIEHRITKLETAIEMMLKHNHDH